MRAALLAVAVVALWVPSSSVAALRWSAPVLIDQTDSQTNPIAPRSPYVTTVDCPSRTLCLAFSGNRVSSTTRPGRIGAWSEPRPVFPNGGPDKSVSCASASRCVAIAGDQIAISLRPRAGIWRLTGTLRLTNFDDVTGLSCPSASLCVAVDYVGDVITSRHPFGSLSTWTVTPVESGLGVSLGRGLSGVSCPSMRLCTAIDDRGNVLTSTNPTGGASAWRIGQVLPDREVQGFPNGLVGVSCPSVSACVGVNRNGDIASSGDPAAGASSWRVIHDQRGTGLSSVSCVSSSLCVAAGPDGVLWSRSPTTSRPRWTRTDFGAVPPWRSGGDISCPSPTLCVAGSWVYLASTLEPTGRTSAWKFATYHNSQSLDGISCPAVALCVAVDDAGGAVVSSAPAAKRSAWRRFAIPPAYIPVALSAVSCPSARLCVGIGSAETNGIGSALVVSTNPAKSAAAWKMIPALPGDPDLTNDPAGNPVGAMSCPSTSLCVGAGAGGTVVVSTHPAGGASAWHVYGVDKESYPCGNGYTCGAAITGISCPAVSFCLGVDDLGNTVTSTDPTDASSWTVRAAGLGARPEYLDFPNGLAVSCPSSSLCVVASSSGQVETSTNPTGDATAWRHTDLDDTTSLSGVSCRTASFCVAVDGAGNTFTSYHPTGGASAWERFNANRGIPLNAVSCATRSLCVAVDGSGYATISRAAAP